MPSTHLRPVAAVLLAVAAASGCAGTSTGTTTPGPPPSTSPPASSASPSSASSAASPAGSAGALLPALSRYSKVLLVAMENKTEGEVIGNPEASYLTSLSQEYGRPAKLDAGYPANCPSLAAYLLMTSGSTHGVCDDRNPSAHPISGPSLFSQLSSTGRQWRNYAEAMPENCADTNSSDHRYAVRHAPAVYYVDERARCRQWQVPLGDLTGGALADDLAAGRLPDFSFVTPDQCHNMHGAPGCQGGGVPTGDAWVKSWMAKILASPDWTAGRLVVVITWDEGTTSDNHIPAVIASPTTRGVVSQTSYTQCSVLRTVSEIVRVPPLGCAAQAPSMLAEFKLAL
jgi:phosphatidylinositol-3-phosphatase